MAGKSRSPLTTPDGRYIVVRGRLWRAANPKLGKRRRDALTRALMESRRAVGAALKAGNRRKLASARAAVQAAKVALGERGPVWWKDGTRDYNRFLAKNTPYRAWFAKIAARSPNETTRRD